MRYSLSLLSLLVSSVTSVAWADDIAVHTKVTEVTVYPQLVEISRRADFDLPVGQHRLILRNIPQSAELEALQVELSGARQTALSFREDGIPPRRVDDPDVRAAEAVIKEVEARIQVVKDDAARAKSEAVAAQTAIGFLEQLGSNEGLAEAGADALRDISRMITSEAGAAGTQVLEAQIRARAIEEQLEDLEDELRAAEQALNAIAREDEDRLYLVIEVEVSEAGPAALKLSYFSDGQTYASPNYEWHLATGPVAEVTLKRGFSVFQATGENWDGVELTISTLQPGVQGAPSGLYPLQRRIVEAVAEPKQQVRNFGSSHSSMMDSLEEPVLEPVIMEETAASETWGADASGPGATYRFGYPVSITSGADILKLELDSLTTEVDLLAVAVPAQDETAYRVARLTNTFGEDLLESFDVPMYVDGKLVAVDQFYGLAAGQDIELGFGALRGLRLSRDVLQKSEGERGVISRSNQQQEVVEISVENLTGETWPLRVLDRVPYTEQEELEIIWSAQPGASEENVDKQRGILAWEFDLAPGADRTIRLETTMNWPEGKLLR